VLHYINWNEARLRSKIVFIDNKDGDAVSKIMVVPV